MHGIFLGVLDNENYVLLKTRYDIPVIFLNISEENKGHVICIVYLSISALYIFGYRCNLYVLGYL